MDTDKILANVAKVDGFMFDKDLGYMVSYNDLDQLTMDILVMYYDLDKYAPFTTTDGNVVSWTDITDAVHEHDQEYICDAYNRGIIGIYTINQVIAGDDARLVVYGTNGCLNGVRYALINENDEPIWGILPDPKPYQDLYKSNKGVDSLSEDAIVDYDDEDEQPDTEFMELDFVELQRYLTECKMAALDAHDEQNWYGEDWWNDKLAQAKTDFLHTYGLSWSDYDQLEQAYKRGERQEEYKSTYAAFVKLQAYVADLQDELEDCREHFNVSGEKFYRDRIENANKNFQNDYELNTFEWIKLNHDYNKRQN